MSKPRSGRATKNAETIAGRAHELWELTADVAGEKVADARKRLGEALEQAQDTAEDAWESATTRAKAADKFIRANPYAALGIGIGVGVLLGFLLRGRDD